MNRLSIESSADELAASHAYADANAARAMAASPIFRILFFVLGHMVLAVVINQSALIATAHALGTLALGLYFLARDEQPTRVIYVTAYIVGMELLWRGGGARVFWEYGKYAVAGLMLLTMFKQQTLLKSAKLPFLIVILLLPSILVMPAFDRGDISFNVSGGFLLGIATMFFSTVQLTVPQLKRVLLMMVAPAMGLAMLSNFVILTSESIEFIAGTKATSGGIGPNQVASILGLGITGAFFYAVLEKKSIFLRYLFILTFIWLLGQAALTLSRGGVWTGVGSVVVAGVFLMRDRRTRGILVASLLLTAVLGTLVVAPFLDSFSRGAVSRRLQDTDLTGRDRIVQADLIAFRQNPIFGLGPGQSYDFHALTFRGSSAHTEYSRLLAEHGLFGLTVLLLMLVVGLQNGLFTRSRSRTMRAIALGCVAWTFLYMIHSAMRLAAPAYIFGLAAVTFIEMQMPAEDPLG